MSKAINIHEAKTNFSKLIVRVTNGEEIIISKAGNHVAKLVPISKKQKRRLPGSAKGKIKISDDFYKPLPKDIIEVFENENST